MDLIVKCRNLWKWYPTPDGRLDVLKGLNFELRYGEFVAILGASGVGKTTFLSLLGLIDTPCDGEVIVDGISPYEISSAKAAEARAKKIGFVFQFHHLMPEFTALENLILPQLIAGESYSKAKNRAKELLHLFGMQGRENHFPGQLSGGEAQRIALARALVNSPKLVLADEPTGNLDRDNALIFMEYLRKLQRQNGLSVVLATHNPEIARFADTIYRLRDGKLWRVSIESVPSK